MKNWKSRFAKEWLIFLSTFIVVIFLYYIFMFLGNVIIEKKYQSDLKEYDEQIKLFIQKYLSDWKPNKSSDLYDIIENNRKIEDRHPKDLIELMRIDNVVDMYKKMNTMYQDIDNNKLIIQLPKMDWSKVPDRPLKPNIYTYYYVEVILFCLLSYLSVLLVRLTLWSIKYRRRDKLQKD